MHVPAAESYRDCQTPTQSMCIVAGSGVVPGTNLLFPIPSADVKARKNGWSNGSGAKSGFVT